MMSPGFVDLLLFLVLTGFVVKGWVTGFIRSVITLFAAIGAWILSGMVPLLTSGLLHYSVPVSSPFHAVATRITTYMIMFGLAQAAGFALTGLIENIRIGTIDKFVGLCVGVCTGILVGCFIVSIFFTHPRAYWATAGQRYNSSSIFFKAYSPMVKKLVRPPHRPSEDEDTSASLVV